MGFRFYICWADWTGLEREGGSGKLENGNPGGVTLWPSMQSVRRAAAHLSLSGID